MKKSATFQHSTWEKIFELSNSDNDIDRTYSDILGSIVSVRINLGITQKELSKKSGLTSSMISKIESQNSIPSMKSFLKYIKGLGLDLKFAPVKK